jgi:flagellar assembly protein FliH
VSHGNLTDAPPDAHPAGPLIEIFAYPEAPWTEPASGWAQAFGRASLGTVPGEASSPQSGGHARTADDGRPSRLDRGTNSRTGSGSLWNHASGVASEQVGEDGPDKDWAGASGREAFEADWARQLAEESHRAEERGRREGVEMGLARGREEASQALTVDRERLFAQGAALADSFTEERGHYFHRLEQEAVRLALAIAARILRREAQMDPLLLTGAVRVALGQLAQSTTVRLVVPIADKALWDEALARMPKLEQRPSVVGDPEMKLGACRMETELGSADLSLWSQLKEIEHGFFDRVGAQGAVPVLSEEAAVAAVPEADAVREW